MTGDEIIELVRAHVLASSDLEHLALLDDFLAGIDDPDIRTLMAIRTAVEQYGFPASGEEAPHDIDAMIASKRAQVFAGPSLPTSGETLRIEDSMTLRARRERRWNVGDACEWSWVFG